MRKFEPVRVVSCEREPSYLRDTLNYLGDIKAEVKFQSDTKTHVYNHVDKPYKDIRSNSQYNYATCLSGLNGRVLIEDDVMASYRIGNYLETVYELLESKKRYIVALYACYFFKRDRGKIHLVEYPKHDFYGTQAMIFDPQTSEELSKYIMDNIGGEPYDFLIKHYAISKDIPLYATSYSLFQHIGEISTGLGNHHQTGTFIDDYIN